MKKIDEKIIEMHSGSLGYLSQRPDKKQVKDLGKNCINTDDNQPLKQVILLQQWESTKKRIELREEIKFHDE